MPVSLLLAFRWPLIGLAITGAIYATYLYIGRLQARVEAAEVRAQVAETRADLAIAAKEIEARHEIAIASLPAAPVYASGLRRLCDPQPVRVAPEAGNNQAPSDTEASVPTIEAVADDIRACEVDAERHNAAVELLDAIYAANQQQ